MTKVSIMSDLHLEMAPPPELPGGDILLLAGDIFSSAIIRSHHGHTGVAEIQRRFVNFCMCELSKYGRVLYVTGNHEPYQDIYEESHRILRNFLAAHAPNVQLLDNQSVNIDGVEFLGTTLWTPAGVDKNGTLTDAAYRLLTGMNDFNIIQTRGNPTEYKLRKFSPADASRLHNDAVEFIKARLKVLKRAGTPAIILGHHAPSTLSKDGNARYGGTDMDAGYYSNQHKLIKSNPHLAMWVHGHTHHSCRYQIEQTTVVSNQQGYRFRERSAELFDPAAADFDLDDIKASLGAAA